MRGNAALNQAPVSTKRCHSTGDARDFIQSTGDVNQVLIGQGLNKSTSRHQQVERRRFCAGHHKFIKVTDLTSLEMEEAYK